MSTSQQSPRTLAQYALRALLPKLVLLAAAFALVAPGYLAPNWEVGTDAEVMETRPHVADSPAALVAGHDCWSGEAPADMVGTVPGHVVVTVGGETRKAGAAMVGKALGQMFDGERHGLVVHGFCR